MCYNQIFLQPDFKKNYTVMQGEREPSMYSLS